MFPRHEEEHSGSSPKAVRTKPQAIEGSEEGFDSVGAKVLSSDRTSTATPRLCYALARPSKEQSNEPSVGNSSVSQTGQVRYMSCRRFGARFKREGIASRFSN